MSPSFPFRQMDQGRMYLYTKNIPIPKDFPGTQEMTRMMLKRARQLVKRGMARTVLARRRDGVLVEHNAPDACYFCLLGALMRAYSELVIKYKGYHFQYVAEDVLYSVMNPTYQRYSLAAYSDAAPKRVILDDLSKAIGALKER